LCRGRQFLHTPHAVFVQPNCFCTQSSHRYQIYHDTIGQSMYLFVYV
jgi:hypothetical protein